MQEVLFKYAPPRIYSEFFYWKYKKMERVNKQLLESISTWNYRVYSSYLPFGYISQNFMFSVTKDQVYISLADSKPNVFRWRQRHICYETMEDRSTLQNMQYGVELWL